MKIKVLRLLAGFLGFGEIAVGILVIYKFGIGSTIHSLGAIGLVGVGAVFLNFALTGKTWRKFEYD